VIKRGQEEMCAVLCDCRAKTDDARKPGRQQTAMRGEGQKDGQIEVSVTNGVTDSLNENLAVARSH